MGKQNKPKRKLKKWAKSMMLSLFCTGTLFATWFNSEIRELDFYICLAMANLVATAILISTRGFKLGFMEEVEVKVKDDNGTE